MFPMKRSLLSLLLLCACGQGQAMTSESYLELGRLSSWDDMLIQKRADARKQVMHLLSQKMSEEPCVADHAEGLDKDGAQRLSYRLAAAWENLHDCIEREEEARRQGQRFEHALPSDPSKKSGLDDAKSKAFFELAKEKEDRRKSAFLTVLDLESELGRLQENNSILRDQRTTGMKTLKARRDSVLHLDLATPCVTVCASEVKGLNAQCRRNLAHYNVQTYRHMQPYLSEDGLLEGNTEVERVMAHYVRQAMRRIVQASTRQDVNKTYRTFNVTVAFFDILKNNPNFLSLKEAKDIRVGRDLQMLAEGKKLFRSLHVYENVGRDIYMLGSVNIA